jgi:hypothetical protein
MGKRKAKLPPFVMVTWVDAAFSTNPHWQDGSVPTQPKGKSLNRCYSSGFLTFLDDSWIQIVTTITDNAHGHVTEIPRGMVQDIKYLELDKN